MNNQHLSRRTMHTRISLAIVFATIFATTQSVQAGQQLPPWAPLPGDMTRAPALGNQDEPFIVAGPDQYLAVYEDGRLTAGREVGGDPYEVYQTDLYATRLAPDGSALDVAPVVVNASPYSQENPGACFNGTDYLIAFESRGVNILGTGTTRDLWAVRVRPSGEVLDYDPIILDDSDDAHFAPAVGSDGTDWIVVFSDGADLLARRVDAAGNVGPEVTVASSVWTYDCSVAFAQGRYLIAWEGGIKCRLYDANLSPLSSQISLSNWADDADPSVATDGTDFFVAWTYLDSYHPVVRGTRVFASGAVQNPGGVPLDGQAEDASSGPSLVWNGAHYVAGWSERFYAGSAGYQRSVKFNRFDANGTPLGSGPTTVLASTEFDPWQVRLASLGQGQSFIGWTDARDGTKREFGGYGALIDSAGGVGPQVPFTVAPPAQLTPDLALGPQGATRADDVNLAVFVSADARETRVVFQRVNGDGLAFDPEPVLLAGGVDTYEDTAVAWNGSEFLVVWEQTQPGFPAGHVRGMRVRPDGSVLDSVPFSILVGGEPDVAALAGDFLVVASAQHVHESRRIEGMRVRGADGALLDASPLSIGPGYASAPSVEAFADRWLVAWHRASTHDSPYTSMRAALVLASGAVQAPFSPGGFNSSESGADLTVVGNVATLAWSVRDHVRVRQIQFDGTLLGPSSGVQATSGAREAAPTVAWDGARFVLSSVDRRNQLFLEPLLGDLFGTRLSAALGVLDPGGLPLAADPRQPEGEAAIEGRGGRSLVLHPAILNSHGNWRVSIGLWSSGDEVGTRYCFCPSAAAPCGNADANAGCSSGSGVGASLTATGTTSVAGDDLYLHVAQATPSNFGIAFMGPTMIMPTSMGNGLRCVGGSLHRFLPAFVMDSTGRAILGPMVERSASLPPAGQIVQGSTWSFQVWYRDPAGACGANSNVTNAVSVTFTP